MFQGNPPKIKPLINSITEKVVAKIKTVEKFFCKLKNEQIKVTKPQKRPKNKGIRINAKGIKGLKISSNVRALVIQ